MFETTAPILPAQDFDQTSAFYQSLGFEEAGRWAPDASTIMAQDKVELHFANASDRGPEGQSSSAYVRLSDIDAFARRSAVQALPKHGRPSASAPTDTSWGMREMEILDPNGNLIRIGAFV